ncbi:hypothetical protein DITRI_Ditri14bG0142000 [Diplodiscus trichospermus]
MGFPNSFFRSFLLLIFALLCRNQVQAATNRFNVLKYGASGDGKTDNSNAFSDVWEQACQSGGNSVILIPPGTYLVHPIIFQGPCKGAMTFQVKGVVKAPTDAASIFIDHWISFRYIDRLRITGGGSFDGQGASAWSHNTCQIDPNCPPFPVTIRFDFVTNSGIDHITSINSKNFHFNIFASAKIRIEHVTISAPGDSPNTDGIHIAESTDIHISDSNIATGDDCVSMGPGSKNINITNVHCGPGHGFSIGSLGRSPIEKDVTGVTVRNCILTETLNGLRIKTWSPSHSSTCSDITFEHINFNNVSNPIFIDQNYCPTAKCGHLGKSRVEIEGARFRNIWGTSSTKIAVNLQCSRSTPCQKIELRDINIDYHGDEEGSASSCANVKGVAYGKQNPASCI